MIALRDRINELQLEIDEIKSKIDIIPPSSFKEKRCFKCGKTFGFGSSVVCYDAECPMGFCIRAHTKDFPIKSSENE